MPPKRRRSEVDALDPEIEKHFQYLAASTNQSVQQVFEASPWRYIIPTWTPTTPAKRVLVDDRLSKNCSFDWLNLGTVKVDCISNVRANPGWRVGDVLECDLSITYPKYLAKRSLRASASQNMITTGTLLRVTSSSSVPPEKVPCSANDLLEHCASRLRRELVVVDGSSKPPVIKSTGRMTETESLTGLPLESYVAEKLTSSRPADLVSAVLLVISPTSTPRGRTAPGEFVGGGQFLTYSGNAFVRLMYKGRDVGKFDAAVSNTLAVLVALDLVHVGARVAEPIPQVFELGESIGIDLTLSLSRLAFQQEDFVPLLVGEAQGVCRNAILALFSRVMRWSPARESVLWSITAVGEVDDEAPSTPAAADEGLEPAESTIIENEDEIGRRNNQIFGTGSIDTLSTAKLSRPSERVFVSILRQYQTIAFNWMRDREGSNDVAEANDDNTMSLWDEFSLKSPSGNTLYMNHMSGALSLERPRSRKNCVGGILADEMGLGKTVVLLSLFSSDIDPKTFARFWSTTGGTLIVMPLSLVSQWTTEIDKHLHKDRLKLKVVVYQSNDRQRSVNVLQAADIVITTYGTVLSESNSMSSSPLYQISWHRIVLDEAHFIKSRLSRTARAIFALDGNRRWCLTGTPVQNTFDDIYSLFHFLKLEPWGHWSWWTKLVSGPDEGATIQRLQKVTSTILLRRTIKTIDPATNKPILTLPHKTVVALWLEFSPTEREFYDTMFNKAVSEFNHFMAQGLLTKNYTGVLQLLLRLRQCCCHPMLVYSGAANQGSILGPLRAESDVDAVARQFAKSLAQHCGRTGSEVEAFIKRQVRKFAPKATKALDASLNTQSDATQETCPICMDSPELPVIAHCGHVMCSECAQRALQHSTMTGASLAASSGSVVLPRLKQHVAACPICRTPFSSLSLRPLDDQEGGWKSLLESLCFTKDGEFNFSAKLHCLDHILRVIIRRGYRVVVFSQWVTCLDIIEKLLIYRRIPYCRLDGSQTAETRRSQIARFTAPIQGSRNEPPPRLDELLPGQVDVSNEDQPFSNVNATWEQGSNPSGTEVGPPYNPDGMVLLASLKAGGVGLNLTAASYLVLIDSWWNPATEEQAMQRVHRIGQTVPVIIFRMYVKNSIEERIIELHQAKTNVARGVLGDASAVDAPPKKSWSLDEMRKLFLINSPSAGG